MRYPYSIPQSEFSPGIELFSIIDKMRAGDVLAVPDVTHIALTWRDLEWILHLLAERTAFLEVRRSARKQGESPEAGFKRDLRESAIRRAQVGGRYKDCGRKRVVDREAVVKLAIAGKGPAAIARELQISISSVARALRTACREPPPELRFSNIADN